MGLSESFFWESTPRKIITMTEQYRKIKKENMKTLAIYIAGCVWGKNIDDFDREDEGIAGIDKPVNPEALKGFYM